jgi:hypothetical protein
MVKGMKFTDVDLGLFIEGGSSLPTSDHVTVPTPPPPGTTLTPGSSMTPAQLIENAKPGQLPTAKDLLALKDKNGKTLATPADFIKLMEKGGTVTPADVTALQAAKVAVTGEDLAKLVDPAKFGDKSVKFTADDLVKIAKGGTQIKEDQLKHITNNCGIVLTEDQFRAINPISLATGKPYVEGTGPLTPEAQTAMADFSGKKTLKDLQASKTGGATVTPEEVKKFLDGGGLLTPKDLCELQRTGTKFTGKDLASLQTTPDFKGVNFTPADLVALSKRPGGTPIFEDELRHIVNNSGMQMTVQDFLAINPVRLDSKAPRYTPGNAVTPAVLIDAKSFGVNVTAQDMLSLVSPWGKVVTNVDLMAFINAGGTLTGKDLIQFQKQFNPNSGALPLQGSDVAEFARQKGVSISVDDVIALSKNGITFSKTSLDNIAKLQGFKVTPEQEAEILPPANT